MLKALAELYNDTEIEAINALKLDEDQEKKKLSAEYESIVKKQLQMLQADERGKQALLNEISNIKQEQRKRSEALKARKKALLIEKERSKRIAALPPPLPKSVKLLLKEQDKKEPDTLAGLQLSPPQEQALYPVEEEIDVFEDKENMDDDDLCRAQRKLQQEEWNRKAKKRFNEAIRKDRQKQEHAQILKEIEEAEKTSRRQMARSLTVPGGTVPCPLSDRLNHMEKQAVLEDAVEKVFNKSKTTKEHAIEDLEGYEDKWEAKYKRIDSTLEAKMIDCVPNFLKQNYSYLLEEEPAQPCGNRFGRLNDSSEDLNEAYIESPTDRMSGSDKIAAVLSHLDQMMSESNALLERDFKPLLKAEGLKADQPKVESFDKAVEANILKQPTEDKSTNIQGEPSIRSELPLASTSTQADFMSSGVMAFKRRSLGSRYKPYMGNLLDPQAQVPTWVEPAETVPSNGSWSSSSYRSLPSKFGQPGICQLCDSPSCNLPLVEGHHRDCIPMSKSIERTQLERKSSEKSATYPKDVLEGSKSSELSQEDISSRSSTSTEDKSNILSFVQIIAQKYLKKHQEELEEQASSSRDDEIRPKEVPEKVISGGLFSSKESESKSFAIPKQPTSNKSNTQQIELQDRSVTSEEKSLTKPEQDQFVQRCHDILSEKLSDLFTEDVEEDETEVLSTLKSAVAEEGKAKLSPGDFVYHELSTILEMDSALTNDMPSLRDASKKTSRSSSLSSISKMSGELISSEEVDTTSASLVDVPVSEATELAKNIQFVSEPLKSVADPQTPLGLISGNISSFQTPSPQVVAELTKDARSVSKSTKTSELSEPKTPFSRVTGMPTDIQTPSPYVAAEALPRKPFSSEHLTTPSQLTVTSGISTPSILKTVSSSTLGSKDLLTPISQLSPQSRPSESVEVMPYSSSHRFTNLRHPYLTNLTDDLPQYFKDISSIQQENQQEDGRPTVPKTVASDLTSNQLFFPKNFDGKFHTDEDSSSFKPMTPHSYVSSPGALPTDPHAKAKPGYYQPRKESHNKFQREETSSSSYKPMTPYVSSQGALHYSPDNKSKERSPKYNNQATVSSQGSFKPKTPHSYYSEGAMHTEIDNKSKNDYQRELEIPKSTNGPLHSTENTQVGYKPLQSHFLMPSPIEKQGQTDRLDAFTNRYFSNLKASSLQKGHDSQNTNSRNVQPMTPPTSKPSHFCVQDKNSHETKSPTAKPYTNTEPESSESEVSTPRTISPVQKIKDWITSPSEGMTPHYCISSPNLPSQSQGLVQESKGKPTNAKAWMSTKDSVDDFQAMAPHSYLSEPNLNSLGAKQSPGKKSNQKRMLSPLQNEQYLSENDGFQPVTLYTYQSTPDLRSQKEKGPTERNGGQESVATENGYQAMTPHSYVSSEENLRSSSSSLKLRLRIPVNLINSSSQETAYTEDGQNVIPSTGSNKSPGFEAKGQNYGLKDSQGEHKAKKVPRSDFFVPQLSPADLDIEKHTPKSKKDAENPDLRNEIVEYLLNDSSNEKKAMKVPRSDFFVPQLSAAELAIDQKLEEDQKSLTYAKSSSSGLFAEPKSTPRTNKGYFTSSISEVSSIRSSGIKTYTDSTPSSSSITSSSVSGLNTRELLTDGTASSKTGYGSVSSLSSGTPNFSVESPNPILEALRKKFALSSSSQASSLYSTPLSTQGPSSDSSVSKISSQSTPLKTIEDIIQETGIMDEPDLTLVTTNLTIKPGSPERTRLFLENRSLMIDRQDQPTQSNNEVTENKAAGGNSYADSPSMMSFLQHENSCLRESNNGEYSFLTHEIAYEKIVQNDIINEYLMHDDEDFGRQFNRNQPKFDYQKRTKRLWNNLEEVKTKKMMEEKKKKIAENRLKMKAYTKVYKKN